MSGNLMSFTPAEVSGISTPVITQHLPTGAITYNASGVLNQIPGTQTGGRRSKRSSKSKKNKSKRTRSGRSMRSSKSMRSGKSKKNKSKRMRNKSKKNKKH